VGGLDPEPFGYSSLATLPGWFADEDGVPAPNRRIFLLTEIIHNPRVNQRMVEMGIIFLSGQNASAEHSLENITPEDVVLIPAFGSVGSETDSLAAARGASRSVLVELRSILAGVAGQVRGLQ
jgi:4-hydroxy-3-methylbut-2-enyl diphosphate reductase